MFRAEKHWRHLLSRSRNSLMTVRSHIELPAQTHPQFIAFAFGYYVCVRSFNYTLLCGQINSSLPQGHQSQAHPRSCCALRHPPSTALKVHFVCVSLSFTYAQTHLASVFERLAARWKIAKRHHNMITSQQDYTKCNFV